VGPAAATGVNFTRPELRPLPVGLCRHGRAEYKEALELITGGAAPCCTRPRGEDIAVLCARNPTDLARQRRLAEAGETCRDARAAPFSSFPWSLIAIRACGTLGGYADIMTTRTAMLIRCCILALGPECALAQRDVVPFNDDGFRKVRRAGDVKVIDEPAARRERPSMMRRGAPCGPASRLGRGICVHHGP
jgi:hypothetical protein